MDKRDDRIGEAERERSDELARDEAELAQIQVTLKRLRELRGRINRRELEPGDWAVFRALIEEEMETR